MLFPKVPHAVLYALLFFLILILSLSHLSWDADSPGAAGRVLRVLTISGDGSRNPFSSSKLSDSDPDHQPNIYHALRRHSINNTVTIVPINNGMLPYAMNMICTLKNNTDFDPTKLVFWTLGEEVGALLREQGLTTFHDPDLWGTSQDIGSTYGKTFQKMMNQRPKFWVHVLETGLDMLFLDTDLIFFQSPLKLISPDVDLAIASDGREYFGGLDTKGNPFKDPGSKGDMMPPVCAGTFWVKSGHDTLNLFRIMQNVMEDDPSTKLLKEKYNFHDDQRAFDTLLNDGRANLVDPLPMGIEEGMLEGRKPEKARLKVQMWDQVRVVSGHLFLELDKQYEEKLRDLEAMGGERWLIHLNWNAGATPKHEGAKKKGIWMLDEDGECLLKK